MGQFVKELLICTEVFICIYQQNKTPVDVDSVIFKNLQRAASAPTSCASVERGAHNPVSAGSRGERGDAAAQPPAQTKIKMLFWGASCAQRAGTVIKRAKTAGKISALARNGYTYTQKP